MTDNDVMTTPDRISRQDLLGRLLTELAGQLLHRPDVEETSVLVLEQARQLTGSPLGFVGYIDPDTGSLVCPTMARDMGETCGVPDKSIAFREFSGLWGWVLTQRQPLICNDPSTDPHSSGVPAGHIPISRFISVPVMGGDTLLGQIALANAPHPYSDADLHVLTHLAVMYALAIRHHLDRERLRQQTLFLEQQVAERTAHLERNRAELAAIYRYAPVMMCVLDERRTVRYANLALCEFTGLTEEELREGRSSGILGCIHALDDPQGCGYGPRCEACPLRLAMADTFATGISHDAIAYRSTLLRHGREEEVALQGATALIQPEGQPPHLLLCLKDVGSQERAASALQESEERLDAVLTGSKLGYWDWDIVKGTVHRNRRWAEMLGYTLEEIEFSVRQWTDLIHPDDRKLATSSLTDHLEGQTAQHAVEYRMRTKEGGYRWILDQATIVRRDRRGSPLRMSGTHTDITGRKRIEEVLSFLARTAAEQGSEDFFQHLARYLASSLEMDFVCIDILEEGNLSARTLAMFVDGVFEDNVSYTLADTPCGEVVANSVCCYRDGVRHHFQKDQVLQEMLAESYVGTILWSADERPIGLIAVIGRTPLADPELAQKILGVVGVRAAAELERMISAEALHKTLAELSRSNEELERFAYVASHDLQEPIRIIVNYAQLLELRYADRLDGPAREFIGYMVDGARRMHQMINALLAYSRVGTQGGKAELTDTAVACEKALGNLKLVVEQADATVTMAGLPSIMADSGQLVQLFQNLIANALKFHGAARPHIDIRAEELADEWRFAVTDNGIGLDPAQSSRIFHIFQRLHGYSEYPGTGIGLSICKRIVERHGGRIWVISEPGNGATFLFTIAKALPTALER